MEELERPKRRALTDAELASELTKFPSDNIGIERAQALISLQQQLREEDSRALEAWFERMRARDDALSRGLIRETLEELFPVIDSQQPADVTPEPVFTSEISVVTRRKVLTQRLKLSQFGAGFNRALMLALVSVGVSVWLDVYGFDLLVAYLVGGSLAFWASTGLRSHDLHPILRSAAVFGGRGVYLFAPLVLTAIGLLLLTSLENDTPAGSIELGFGYQALAVAVTGIVTLLTQLLPARFHAIAFGLLGMGALLITLLMGELTPSPSYTGDWLWAAIAIGVVGFLLLTFAMPHLRSNLKVDLASWALGSLLLLTAVSSVDYQLNQWSMTIVLGVLVFAVAASGRDIAGGLRSRLLALSVVLAAMLSPIGDAIGGILIASIAATTVVLLADQLLRRQPLHLASLDTSYGFYGSFQILSWLALILAGLLGSESVISLLSEALTASEWALVLGVGVGVVISLLRIPVIRKQDAELENIDPRNSRLENLLGL